MLNKILKFFGLLKTLEDKSVQKLLIDDGWIATSDVAIHTHHILHYRFQKTIYFENRKEIIFILHGVDENFSVSFRCNIVWFTYEKFNNVPTQKQIKKLIGDTKHFSNYENVKDFYK